MIRIAAAALLLASLAACNTVQGIGRDLSAGGAVISGAADHARPARHVPRRAPHPHYGY